MFSLAHSYKAEYDYHCCAFLCGQYDALCINRSRKYFYVLENGYETSGGACCNGGSDGIFKAYFDRGIYDMRSCAFRTGVLRGAPSVFPNNTRYVCCCNECSPGCNDYCECYWPSMCGDRVRVLPAEYVCCCFPTRSCWIHNCCGLCGVATGDPLPSFLVTFASSLKVGTANSLAQSMEGARAAWKARTGLP